MYPGHTLILGDSFYDSPGVLAGQAVYAGALFAPFLTTLTADYVLADPASFTQDIIDADTVVMEVAERSLSSGGVPLSAAKRIGRTREKPCGTPSMIDLPRLIFTQPRSHQHLRRRRPARTCAAHIRATQVGPACRPDLENFLIAHRRGNFGLFNEKK